MYNTVAKSPHREHTFIKASSGKPHAGSKRLFHFLFSRLQMIFSRRHPFSEFSPIAVSFNWFHPAYTNRKLLSTPISFKAINVYACV